MRYFDTSFLAPLILPEATSEPIAGFFESLPADDLAVSDWTRVEFASLLAREVRMGGLDAVPNPQIHLLTAIPGSARQLSTLEKKEVPAMCFTTSLSIPTKGLDARRVPTCLKAAVLFLGSAVAIPMSATAQMNLHASCAAIFNVSRTVETRVLTEDQFFLYRNNFCNEHRTNNRSGRSRTYGISYKFLGVSSGENKLEEEQVYEKYCEGKDIERRNNNDYEEYASFIPREAFDSYNQCITSRIATSGDLIFYASNNIMEEKMLLINVGTTESRKVTATPVAKNVQCTWKDKNEEPVREKNGPDGIFIGHHAKVELSCTRDNFEKNTLIAISAPRGTNAGITLNWPKFVRVDEDYEPQYVMEDMRNSIQHLKKSMESQNWMLRAELEELQNSTIRIESGIVEIHSDGTNRLSHKLSQNEDRRIEGTVDFQNSFSYTPKVVMAIQHQDLSPDHTIRLEVKPISITKEGFKYQFGTWHKSRVFHAVAIWLAYGK